MDSAVARVSTRYAAALIKQAIEIAARDASTKGGNVSKIRKYHLGFCKLAGKAEGSLGAGTQIKQNSLGYNANSQNIC
jgi:hypothetical protein